MRKQRRAPTFRGAALSPRRWRWAQARGLTQIRDWRVGPSRGSQDFFSNQQWASPVDCTMPRVTATISVALSTLNPFFSPSLQIKLVQSPCKARGPDDWMKPAGSSIRSAQRPLILTGQYVVISTLQPRETKVASEWNRSREMYSPVRQTQGNNSARALSTKIVFFGCKKIDNKRRRKQRRGQTRRNWCNKCYESSESADIF